MKPLKGEKTTLMYVRHFCAGTQTYPQGNKI